MKHLHFSSFSASARRSTGVAIAAIFLGNTAIAGTYTFVSDSEKHVVHAINWADSNTISGSVTKRVFSTSWKESGSSDIVGFRLNASMNAESSGSDALVYEASVYLKPVVEYVPSPGEVLTTPPPSITVRYVKAYGAGFRVESRVDPGDGWGRVVNSDPVFPINNMGSIPTNLTSPNFYVQAPNPSTGNIGIGLQSEGVEDILVEFQLQNGRWLSKPSNTAYRQQNIFCSAQMSVTTGDCAVVHEAHRAYKATWLKLGSGANGIQINSGWERADVDGDNEVGPGDLEAIIDAFGSADQFADVNDDGEVGPTDFEIIVQNFGATNFPVNLTIGSSSSFTEGPYNFPIPLP